MTADLLVKEENLERNVHFDSSGIYQVMRRSASSLCGVLILCHMV